MWEAIKWLIKRALAYGVGYIGGWLAFFLVLAIIAGLLS